MLWPDMISWFGDIANLLPNYRQFIRPADMHQIAFILGVMLEELKSNIHFPFSSVLI